LKDLLNILVLATVNKLGTSHSTFLHSNRSPYTYPHHRQNKTKIGTSAERTLANAQWHDTLLCKLSQPKYCALYIAVAHLFASCLAEDLRILDMLDALSPDADHISLLHQISLAGKWALTPHKHCHHHHPSPTSHRHSRSIPLCAF
jgi:Domain of unknown function (DUF2828)